MAEKWVKFARTVRLKKQAKCEEHDLPNIYYCLLDKEPICEMCAENYHSTHRVQEIRKARDRLEKGVEKAGKLQAEYVKQMDSVGVKGGGKQLRRRGRRALHQLLEDRKQLLHQALDQACQKLHENIDQHYGDLAGEGDKMEGVVTENLEQLFRARKMGEKALNVGDPGEMVRVDDVLEMLLRQQLSQPDLVSPEVLMQKADALQLIHPNKEAVELMGECLGRVAKVDRLPYISKRRAQRYQYRDEFQFI